MPIQLMGTVTKVVWNNPHVWLNVDVKDGGGKITTWQLELASPNGLIREGWKVDSLRRGDQITADGFPAREWIAFSEHQESHLNKPLKVSKA